MNNFTSIEPNSNINSSTHIDKDFILPSQNQSLGIPTGDEEINGSYCNKLLLSFLVPNKFEVSSIETALYQSINVSFKIVRITIEVENNKTIYHKKEIDPENSSAIKEAIEHDELIVEESDPEGNQKTYMPEELAERVTKNPGTVMSHDKHGAVIKTSHSTELNIRILTKTEIQLISSGMFTLFVAQMTKRRLEEEKKLQEQLKNEAENNLDQAKRAGMDFKNGENISPKTKPKITTFNATSSTAKILMKSMNQEQREEVKKEREKHKEQEQAELKMRILVLQIRTDILKTLQKKENNLKEDIAHQEPIESPTLVPRAIWIQK